MSWTEPVLPIPSAWRYSYWRWRFVLYLASFIITLFFTLSFLFPSFTFFFNFEIPGSNKNTILKPHSPTGNDQSNGKIQSTDSLIGNMNISGNFSEAQINIALEQKSPVPKTLDVSLRKSYFAFLFPDGSPVTSFPQATLYRISDTYYELRDGVLFPFISDAAYLSRYPDAYAIPTTTEFLTKYPLSENKIGFRVGTLISFADGVFLVNSETEVRPIGSADIFLSFGYSFQDVIAVHEEELGIYTRGRIFLMHDQHSDGTLFLDQDTHTYYLIDQGTKRPLLDTSYLNFLLTTHTAIQASQKTSECVLIPTWFSKSLQCYMPLKEIQNNLGNNFEITIHGDADNNIELKSLRVILITEKNKQNTLFILSRIKQRVLDRFGLSL